MIKNEIGFSAVICVYKKDNPIYFDNALNSITREQTLKPNELIIVADGELTRELDDVIEKYTDELNYIKVYRLQENMGHGIARAKGIEVCNYKYVALMDADDISVRDRFESQIRYLSENKADVLGGQIAEFEKNESNVTGYRMVPEKDKDIKEYLKKRCPFNQVTVMLNKEKVMDAGGYMDWYCNEDYYLWIRMYLKDSRFANIDRVLVNVRTDNGMMNRRGGYKYFKSEKLLQDYMLENKVIGRFTYVSNVVKRFILQVIMTPKLRAAAYKLFARKHNQ